MQNAKLRDTRTRFKNYSFFHYSSAQTASLFIKNFKLWEWHLRHSEILYNGSSETAEPYECSCNAVDCICPKYTDILFLQRAIRELPLQVDITTKKRYEFLAVHTLELFLCKIIDNILNYAL